MLGYELRGLIACAARRESSNNRSAHSDKQRDAPYVIHRYLPMRAPPSFLLGSKMFPPERLFSSSIAVETAQVRPLSGVRFWPLADIGLTSRQVFTLCSGRLNTIIRNAATPLRAA